MRETDRCIGLAACAIGRSGVDFVAICGRPKAVGGFVPMAASAMLLESPGVPHACAAVSRTFYINDRRPDIPF
jgi:hypothetical protein